MLRPTRDPISATPQMGTLPPFTRRNAAREAPLRHLRSLALLGLCALGCDSANLPFLGKQATAEDCEQIVERMTELELQANRITDPDIVRRQVAQTKQSFRERTMKECVGRQIPDDAMSCIDAAKTPNEILSECLD